MLVEEAQERLLGLLRDEGQEPHRLTPLPTWRAFRRFMGVPVTGVEEDAILYQYITAGFGGLPRFIWSLCRQFDLDDGDGQVLIQLRCEIAYEPTPDLKALGTHHQWWSQGEGEPRLTAMLDAVESRPEWSVIANHRPATTSVHQERAC